MFQFASKKFRFNIRSLDKEISQLGGHGSDLLEKSIHLKKILSIDYIFPIGNIIHSNNSDFHILKQNNLQLTTLIETIHTNKEFINYTQQLYSTFENLGIKDMTFEKKLNTFDTRFYNSSKFNQLSIILNNRNITVKDDSHIKLAKDCLQQANTSLASLEYFFKILKELTQKLTYLGIYVSNDINDYSKPLKKVDREKILKIHNLSKDITKNTFVYTQEIIDIYIVSIEELIKLINFFIKDIENKRNEINTLWSTYLKYGESEKIPKTIKIWTLTINKLYKTHTDSLSSKAINKKDILFIYNKENTSIKLRKILKRVKLKRKLYIYRKPIFITLFLLIGLIYYVYSKGI